MTPEKLALIREWDSACELITCLSDPVVEFKLWKDSGENPEYNLTLQDFKAYIESLPEPESFDEEEMGNREWQSYREQR